MSDRVTVENFELLQRQAAIALHIAAQECDVWNKPVTCANRGKVEEYCYPCYARLKLEGK